jgi:large subunit ribosomal protein L30e
MSVDLEAQIARAVKTGTVLMGTNSVLSAVANSRVRAVVVASNYQGKQLEKLKELCSFSDTRLIVYPNSSVQLGRISGRSHPIAMLGIRAPGESQILERLEKEPGRRRRSQGSTEKRTQA